MEALEVRWRKTSTLRAVLLAVASFGLLLPLYLAAYLFDRRFRSLDREGVTTMRGRRYLWSDLVATRPDAHYNVKHGGPDSYPVRWLLRFDFRRGRLSFEPALCENGAEVLRFIETATGRSLGRPLRRREL